MAAPRALSEAAERMLAIRFSCPDLRPDATNPGGRARGRSSGPQRGTGSCPDPGGEDRARERSPGGQRDTEDYPTV